MSRPEEVLQLVIGLGAGISVIYDEGNRRPGGAALECTGKDFHPIRFPTFGTGNRPGRSSSVQCFLNVGFGKG
jgi:hypothetical protein